MKSSCAESGSLIRAMLLLVNVEQAEKASHDLESIIELSNLINKDAQKFRKSTEKTP